MLEVCPVFLTALCLQTEVIRRPFIIQKQSQCMHRNRAGAFVHVYIFPYAFLVLFCVFIYTYSGFVYTDRHTMCILTMSCISYICSWSNSAKAQTSSWLLTQPLSNRPDLTKFLSNTSSGSGLCQTAPERTLTSLSNLLAYGFVLNS